MDNLIGLFEPSKVADLQNWQRAGRRIVFYGAGNIGGLLYDAMVATRQLDVACFCDGDAAKQGTLCRGLPVIPPERLAADCAGDVVVLATMRLADAAAMRERLTALGFAGRIVAFSELIKSDVDANRGICACIHEHHMERFFRDAETPERLAVFWADGHTGGGISPFYEMFKRLDLANVIELACGRGAHVPMYLDRCGHATLVDILPKNIAICRERFKGNPKVSCCANNGRDLRELPGSSFTALFTYDSMVHFEMFDVFEYLKETRRVLSPGAMALFHHSNNHGDSSLAFANAQEGRAFMSKELFGYLALRAGLEIVEQRVIDWVVKDLDCITLVRKVG